MARLSEDELIARYSAPLAGPGGLGLLDDAALVAPTPGTQLVLTVDAIVEGVHFLPDDPPETIAVKALGVNLSDLAAKGATPIGFLLVLALPDNWTEEWLAPFWSSLGAMAEATCCPLLGGDTVRAAGPLTLSITALGEVPDGGMVRRMTARAGDIIAVTGTIGDATLGLALLLPEKPEWAGALTAGEAGFLVERYRKPQPRLTLATPLRQYAHAAMDVSDGLAGDAAKLLRASGVGGTIDLDRVPHSAAAGTALARDPSLRDRLVSGGDDYELLITLSRDRWPEMRARSEAAGIPITEIGRVGAASEPVVFLSQGREHHLASGSYQHSWEKK